MHRTLFTLILSSFLLTACGGKEEPAVDTAEATEPVVESVANDIEAGSQRFDVLITNGMVYDGTGADPVQADIAISGDRITAIGTDLGEAKQVIDAEGLAVSPGFINMLSWATESLIEDGHSQSDIRQGVTLEVMGEGWSMGPKNDAMKEEDLEQQGDIKFSIEWTTLGEYMDYLENKGISTNVASFVGATTVRIHELDHDDRPPTSVEMAKMKELVAQSMEEGALGIGSSLIYAPAFYSTTEELIELSEVAAAYGGRYISHMRSEGARLEEAVEELITISREAGIGAEIYHLKAAGQENWYKLDRVFSMIERARAEGLDITANMYTYTAGATGLEASMPPWIQEGGHDFWVERLSVDALRKVVANEIETPSDEWENLYLAAGGAKNMILIGFKSEELKPLTGKTLAEVSDMRGTTPAETMIDLVVEDNSRVVTAYFIMSEENIRKKIAQPWMAFGSDAESLAPEGVFLQSNPHPRAYGTFARLLGKYVRDEQIISLPEAIRRLTWFPAQNLSIRDRGKLAEGFYADITIFDPAEIQDHSTFEDPHRYSTGVQHVLVNGVPVLLDGEHTGEKPGRFVKGPGAVER